MRANLQAWKKYCGQNAVANMLWLWFQSWTFYFPPLPRHQCWCTDDICYLLQLPLGCNIDAGGRHRFLVEVLDKNGFWSQFFAKIVGLWKLLFQMKVNVIYLLRICANYSLPSLQILLHYGINNNRANISTDTVILTLMYVLEWCKAYSSLTVIFLMSQSDKQPQVSQN